MDFYINVSLYSQLADLKVKVTGLEKVKEKNGMT